MIYVAVILALAGLLLWVRKWPDPDQDRLFGRIGIGGLVVATILVFASTLTIVAPGEVAVPVLFGSAKAPLEEGFHLRNPFASVRALSVRTQESTYSDTIGEGEAADRADAITAVSLENAAVRVEITILWHLVGSEASNVYRSLGTGYRDVIVRPVSRSAVRDCISKYRFELARTTQRPDVERCIEESLTGEFEPRGLAVDGIQLRDIAATPELQASIEAKLQAEQDAQRAQFRQDQARIDADTRVITAGAEAEANQLIAESLTPDLLQLRIVEALSDKAIVYLLGSEGPTPVIPLPTPEPTP
ncbi:MAG TPA: prohibitin family protein [Acidimicrobiia bacterium]|nr:prohibitin family protein [Acidimicrobiia bacterium]